MRFHFLKSTATTLLIAALYGCGGGGGGSSGSPANATGLSGVASAGAPVVNGQISILSLSNGAIYQPTTTTSTDGSYSIAIDATVYPAPYLIKVQDSNSKQAYFSYANDLSSGNLVTPLTSTVLGLAGNDTAENIFNNASSVSNTQFTNAANIVYQAASSVLGNFSVNSASQIYSNSTYSANGSGADSVLDQLKISKTETTAGSVLITTKFPSTGLELKADTNPSSLTSISLNSSITSSILSKISLANAGIINSFNSNDRTSFNSFFDINYLDSGNDATTTFSNGRTFSQANNNSLKVSGTTLNWCQFNSAGLSFGSNAIQLANQSGICNASLYLLLNDGTILKDDSDHIYKFAIDSTGTLISSLKAYGNQFNDSISIYPAIQKKVRVDGTTSGQGHQGLSSGYRFEIGTGLVNNAVTSNTNISAIISLSDSSSNSLGSYYMQCTQASSGNPSHCLDSWLSFCVGNSSTCQGGVDVNNEVDKVSENIVPVDSTLASQILSALKAGPVTANIKTYNTTLDHVTNATAALANLNIPIVGMPVSSSTAASLTLPSLTSSAQSALAAWTGGSTLNLDFDRGQLSVLGAWFTTPANNSGQEVILKPSDSQIKFTQIGTGSSVTAVSSSSHNNCSNTDNYRALYLTASYQNIPVTIKYFGACALDDY